MLQRFNYYGIEKEAYKSCEDSIRLSNRQHSEIIDWWFLLVNILCFVCAKFDWLNVDWRNMRIYADYIIATLAYILIIRFIPIVHRIRLLPTLINIVMLVSYGIVMSNVSPYMIAFMFFIIMLVIAMSFIETMFRMTCLQLVCAGVFIYFSRIKKPSSVSYQDICNTIIILGLSLVLHYQFQRVKIRQFIINNQNIQFYRELEVRSSFDSLTSLLERKTFFNLGGIAMEDQTPFMALCLIDLDGFKQINDQLGHQVGDRAIKITGELINDILQADLSEKWGYKEKVIKEKKSFAGRLGGDEFIVLIRDKENEEEAKAMMEELLDRLNHVEDGEIHGLKGSIGMTRILPEDKNIDYAYKRADDALYESKRKGKNIITVSKCT
ncbi:MAG: GGDEF domain-containing protein [Lachnospiraceae bacterium]|nr:GGDEF domain-containing protein [Lachnospiraceae bacterium]